MTKLDDLLYSLATTIIAYYDGQSIAQKLVIEQIIKKKTYESAVSMINSMETDYKSALKNVIEKCPDSRKPFLHFLLHEIEFLKWTRDQKNSFDEPKFKEYKEQITQLLKDCRQLLVTYKGHTYGVTHTKIDTGSNAVVSLIGLKNDALLTGGEFCTTGDILKYTMNRLNVFPHSTDTEIAEIAESLCIEHQNALKLHELQLGLQAAKKAEGVQQEKTEQLNKQLQQADVKIKQLEEAEKDLLNRLKVQSDKDQGEIAHLREQISALKYPVTPKSASFFNQSDEDRRFYGPNRG